MRQADPDGTILLTTSAVADLLVAAVNHAGGRLISWQLDHIDSVPNHSTTATYYTEVEWSYGRRTELIGVNARARAATLAETQAEVFTDGNRNVTVWFYPHDPELPGLARAAYPEQMLTFVNNELLLGRKLEARELSLDMIAYRPRRRAVVRLNIGTPAQTLYIKVLRPKVFDDIVNKHQLLLAAGVPAPDIAAATEDCLLVLRRLPGIPLARAIFQQQNPCSAEDLIGVLDAMPQKVAKLERRLPWSSAVEHYAEIVSQALPTQETRLEWLVDQISAGLRDDVVGDEPTHGDFHEGQIHVADGRIVGILDVDTIGPGRRADDLACLIAHMSTIQGMNAKQAAQVHDLLRAWVPVFDQRVDPVELRLRAAAVIVSLATGPYRSQEPDWEIKTAHVVSSAISLVRQVI